MIFLLYLCTKNLSDGIYQNSNRGRLYYRTKGFQ